MLDWMPDWVVLGTVVLFIAAAIMAIARELAGPSRSDPIEGWPQRPADQPTRAERSGAPALLGILIVLVVGAGAAWYFLIYDTAAGRCNRGDLGACIVWEAQQQRDR